MKLDPEEQRLGYIWFVCAGTFAVCLSIFLYSTNTSLHTSKAEEDKYNTLLHLRGAQTSLSSGAADPRQHQGTEGSLRVVSAATADESGDE